MQKSIQTPEYGCVLKLLARLRQQSGLTQRDLAKRLKRERSFVWRIEKGERRLDVVEFYWVCCALGIRSPQSAYAALCSSFRACSELLEAQENNRQDTKSTKRSRMTRHVN
jgi:transcriptional regulator with XRE-family HTH domain